MMWHNSVKLKFKNADLTAAFMANVPVCVCLGRNSMRRTVLGLLKLKSSRQRTLISPIQGGYKRLKLRGPHNYYSSKSVTVAAGVRLVVVNITAGPNPAD